MTSAAQVFANRSNAQKSTGPRTPEGKEKASQNALTHGLFSREAVIRGEDEDEFELHRERLLGQLNPVGLLEEILAERVIDLAWRLQRAVQDQSEAFAALYEQQTAGAEEPGNAALLSGNRKKANPDRAPKRDTSRLGTQIGGPGPGMIGRMILEDFSQNAVLERLLRYERRIESSLYRTLNQLRRVHDQLQKADLEDASTLERWREEDWSARKARSFACCPPVNVSPGPAGGTTNTPGAEVPHHGDISSLQYAGPAPDGPPEDETCKTNPIEEDVSWEDESFKGEVSSWKPEELASSPRSLAPSDFTLQTPGGTPTPQSESCKSNPMCAGGSSRQEGYTAVFRPRR